MTRAAATPSRSTAAIAACLGAAARNRACGQLRRQRLQPVGIAGAVGARQHVPGQLATGNLCGGPAIGPVDGANQGGLYAQDILGSPTNMPDGSHAGWTFTAPTGTTITAISYYRTLAAHGDRNVSPGSFTAEGTVLDYCRIVIPLGQPASTATSPTTRPRTFSRA